MPSIQNPRSLAPFWTQFVALVGIALLSNVPVMAQDGACDLTLCPPGTSPLVDADGDFAGWCVSSNQPANLHVAAIDVSLGAFAALHLDLTFAGGPGVGGTIAPVLLDFIQVCPDAESVAGFRITEESIQNQTGVDWYGYQWLVLDGPETWLGTTTSPPISVVPFAILSFEDLYPRGSGFVPKTATASGGVIGAGETFSPGGNGGFLRIALDRAGDAPISFTLKQRPLASYACEYPDPIPDGDVAALIDAIHCANARPGPDVIELAAGGTYALGTIDNNTHGSNGLPPIISDITIHGNGATIDRAGPPIRFFYVPMLGSLTLDSLTLRGGLVSFDDGGAILVEGGQVELTDCTLSENFVSGWSDFPGARGGGIYNHGGTVTITGSTLTENVASLVGGGVYNDGGTLVMTASVVCDGGAGENGGGIAISGGIVTIVESVVSGNLARDDGGGILSENGTLTLERCSVIDNLADLGGGLAAEIASTTLVADSTFDGNRALYVGGGVLVLQEAEATIDRSTISDNTAITSPGLGGGVFTNASAVVLTNSTISGNSAKSGAGLFAFNAIEMRQCTVSGNIAGESVGGLLLSLYPYRVGSLTNCIIANNVTAGVPGGDCYAESDSPIDAGYNIIEDGSCITDPTSMSGDPMLGPLADNGGSTLTHALLPGSIAIDAGDCVGGAITEDQRGVSRPQGPACDIGAFELDVAPIVGDLDNDRDVDLSDFAIFTQCFSGSGAAVASGCASADFDCDGDADLTDFSIFAQAFTGSR